MSSRSSKNSKARTDFIDGFGLVTWQGARRDSCKLYSSTFHARLASEQNVQVITRAVDQITGMKISSTRGHHASMVIVVTIDVTTKRDTDRYARAVSCDLIAAIEAEANKAVRAKMDQDQPARVSKQRAHARR